MKPTDRIDIFEVVGKYNHKKKGNWVSGYDCNDGTYRISGRIGDRYIEDDDVKKVGVMVIKHLKK